MAGEAPSHDPAQVEAIADYVCETIEAAGRDKLKLAVKVGGHIFDEFFGGDPFSFTDKGRGSPSLRALLDHPRVAGLQLSHRTVAYYVKVAIQDRRWDHLIAKGKMKQAVKSLGYTKRVKLLPLMKMHDLIRVATMAVEQTLTAAEIEELVRAANARRTGEPRKPDADAVKASKRLLRAANTLHDTDLGQMKDDELVSATELTQAGLKVANWAADLMAGELATRDGITRKPKLAETLAAETPAALGDLLRDLAGDDLGLEAAIRSDTTGVIRHHGTQILDDLVWADPNAAKEWFLDFASTVADGLDCVEQLGAKLGLPVSSKQARRSGGGRRTWFLISAHDQIPNGPITLESFVEQRHYPPVHRKCVVQAASPEHAVDLLRQGVGIADRDLADPRRVVIASPLRGSIQRGTTLKTYLTRPRKDRDPTLDEYISELKAGTPTKP